MSSHSADLSIFATPEQGIPRRSNLKFRLLMVSVAAFSWGGWVVLGGILPIYLIPLAPLFLILIMDKRNRMSSVEKRLSFLYLAFSLYTFLGAFSALDEFKAFIGSLGWIANYVLIYVAAGSIDSFSSWLKMMIGFTFIQLVSFGFAIPQFFLGTFFISPAAYDSQVAGLEGMSYAFGKNFLLLISLGVCLLLQRQVLKRKSRALKYSRTAFFSLAVAIPAIALSESRSSQVAIGLGCAVMGWRAGLLSGATLKASIIGLFIIAASFYFGAEKWGKVMTDEGLEGDGSFLYRLHSWGAGWRMAQDYWLIGVGMFNYRYHVADYLSDRHELLATIGLVNAEGEIAVEVHNVFIGIGAMAGLPAMGMFLAYYLAVTRLSWKVSKDVRLSDDLRLIGCVTSLYLIMYTVSLSMHNLFNDNLPWVVIGAFLGAYRRLRSDGDVCCEPNSSYQNSSENL